MTDLEQAKADLLAAYRALERAQEQMQQMQGHLRSCETQKLLAQLKVESLEAQEKAG